MAVTTVAFEDLNSWLQAQPENTTSTPYELNITGLTEFDVEKSTTRGTLGYIIRNNNKKYINISATELPRVSSLDHTFSYCSTLVVAPTIPNSVTSLPYTFSDCTSLVNAIIPDSVREMTGTFIRCALTSIIIPNGVTSLIGTFSYCTELTVAPNIPNSVTDLSEAFYGCTSLTSVIIPNNVTRLFQTFYGCTSLVNAPIIPYGVYIMTNTFYGCTSLVTPPDIPNNVTSLSQTFYGCTSLTTAPIIPNNVTNMDSTFKGCTSLTSAPIIPDSVTSMNNTFEDCTSLSYKSILPDSVTSSSDCYNNVTINNWKGNDTQYNSFVSSFAEQQSTAFDVWNVDTDEHTFGVDISNLSTLLSEQPVNTASTPYSIKILGLTTSNYTGIKTALTANNTKCVDLRYTELPSVTSLQGTFEWCETLIYSPQLPSSLEEMRRTFANCTALKVAPAIPSTVYDMWDAFYNCSTITTPPTIPSGVTNINETFCGCSSLTSAPTMPSGVTAMMSTFEGCSSLTSAPTIPSGVTTLESCFKGCSSLTSAPAISSNVTDLSNTFEGCTDITEISLIPSSVTYAKEAFKGCSSLEKIDEFGIALSTITSNEDDFQDMFKGCSSLVQIGYKIDEAEQWHIFRLKFGSSTVEGVIYDKSGNATDINSGSPVSLTKSTLTLPIKTDEVWFPTGYSDDDDIDEIIEKVIANKYTYFKKETIPPDEKTMILWADDKDHFMTNIEMGDILDFDTWAEFEQALPNLPVGQKCAIKEGTNFSTVDRVESGVYNPVTSNAVAQAMGTSLDDTGTVSIASQVTKNLGVTEVLACRKRNLVYLYIGGTYSGQPTTTSQVFLTGLPQKYRPSFDQSGFALAGYNSSQKTVFGRGGINSNGEITLGETAWNNGTQIRSCFIYMI